MPHTVVPIMIGIGLLLGTGNRAQLGHLDQDPEERGNGDDLAHASQVDFATIRQPARIVRPVSQGPHVDPTPDVDDAAGEDGKNPVRPDHEPEASGVSCGWPFMRATQASDPVRYLPQGETDDEDNVERPLGGLAGFAEAADVIHAKRRKSLERVQVRVEKAGHRHEEGAVGPLGDEPRHVLGGLRPLELVVEETPEDSEDEAREEGADGRGGLGAPVVPHDHDGKDLGGAREQDQVDAGVVVVRRHRASPLDGEADAEADRDDQERIRDRDQEAP